MLHRSIIIRRATSICPSIEAGHLARREMENSDEDHDPCRRCRTEPGRWLCLCSGRAGGTGGPELPGAGLPQRSQDHAVQAQVQFLGPNTVLGKMFGYNSESNRVAAATTSAKGG